MALEKQITFRTNVINPIDTEVENFLRSNEVDPAAIQVAIDSGNGVKTVTVTYGNREDIKAAYDKQGRSYSDADAVTYCHVKDIILPFNKDLDAEVNGFLADENISALSISRYFTLANQGAFIFYIDLTEQKEKLTAKQEEIEKARAELAEKLASSAVKDADLDTNDTLEKYSQMSEQIIPEETTSEESTSEATEITTEVSGEVEGLVTAGLSQVEGQVAEVETTVSTTQTGDETLSISMSEPSTTVTTSSRKGLFGKKNK
jgi:hypothetical protein